MFCTKCGTRISNDSQFCNSCGTKINYSLAKVENCLSSEIFSHWYISISFGKSSSVNFPQAVGLAKMAPKYIENILDGQILYQAIYSSAPEEYLMFIKLYELVSNWKSCYVVINGKVIDRKVIQGLNYCYGDRCRAGNKDFCFGASYMTNNIFGCHRLQISASNNPLYTFYSTNHSGLYCLNKEALIRRINEKSIAYKHCPCFDPNYVYRAVNSLPSVLTPQKYNKMRNNAMSQLALTINLNKC